MGTNSISPTCTLRIVHNDAAIAKELAVAGRVDEGIAGHVDKCHGIRTDKVVDGEARLACALVAAIIAAIRICIFIRFEKIKNKIADGKKASHKGSTYHTAKVLGQEQLELIEKPQLLLLKVPIHCLPRHTKINYNSDIIYMPL